MFKLKFAKPLLKAQAINGDGLFIDGGAAAQVKGDTNNKTSSNVFIVVDFMVCVIMLFLFCHSEERRISLLQCFY